MEEGCFQIERQVVEGIERVSLYPEKRRFETPLVFLHGMWHGAWCWEEWQRLFAGWGWESHAISLPGHAGSTRLRPVRRSSLTFYLSHLENEVRRHEARPVLFGHSMGGAVSQWYMKRHDDLAACVLLASWPSLGVLPAFLRCLRLDPMGGLLSTLRFEVGPMVRTPERCFDLFLTPGAKITAAELHARLCNDSYLTLFQFNWPFWRAPKGVSSPVLWVSAGRDRIMSMRHCRRSAARYGADHVTIAEAGHDVMLEECSERAAGSIRYWLLDRCLP